MERYLMTSCGLHNDDQLRRLAVFLAAHTVMDTRLISVLVDHEMGKHGGAGVLSIERQQDISDDVARLTFKEHLRAATPLVPTRAVEIADEVNRARDAFVHWKRGRFELPRYNGQAVVGPEGFQACMDDVHQFLISLVPFRNPGWTANA
jgi:hypothetical protein